MIASPQGIFATQSKTNVRITKPGDARDAHKPLNSHDDADLLDGARNLRHRHRGVHDRAAAPALGRRSLGQRGRGWPIGDGLRAHLCFHLADPDGAHRRPQPAPLARPLDDRIRARQRLCLRRQGLLGADGCAGPPGRRGRTLCPERQRACWRFGQAGTERRRSRHRQRGNHHSGRARRAAWVNHRRQIRLARDVRGRRRSGPDRDAWPLGRACPRRRLKVAGHRPQRAPRRYPPAGRLEDLAGHHAVGDRRLYGLHLHRLASIRDGWDRRSLSERRAVRVGALRCGGGFCRRNPDRQAWRRAR